MNAWTVFGLGWLGLVVIFTAVWAVQLKTRNAGIIDAVWAWTLGALGPWFAYNSSAPLEVRWLIGIMPLVWGLRLGTYLWFRNHGHAEDGRYAQLRKEWGDAQNLRMWSFFQVQVVFSMLIALGLAVASQRTDAPAPVWLWLSVVLWVVSIAGEALADRQLAAFKANPANKGRVCKQGLWKYSRHPNYFFECVHWVAYVPLALGAPWGFLSLIPPAVMAFLLLKMSGIPATEAQAARTRPEYAEYIRTTSAFIPWFPKS